MSPPVRRVVLWAVISRILTVGLMIGSSLYLPEHRATGVLRFAGVDKHPVAAAFVKWDAAWLLQVADKGYPLPPWRVGRTSPLKVPHSDVDFFEEQVHAFFPLYPWIVRHLAACVQSWFGLDWGFALVASAVALSNIAFVASAAALFHLSCSVLGDRRKALWGALAYSFNPASAFFSTAYTESTFAFLTFAGFAVLLSPKAHCTSLRKGSLAWLSAMLLCAATATRSNGVSVVLIFGVAKLHWLVDEALKTRSTRSGVVAALRFTAGALATVLQIALIISPYAAFQGYAYQKFCVAASSKALQMHPWCLRTVPSLYAWVQERYWGVGLLRYYTVRNIPNFLLAAPVVAVSAWGVMELWRRAAWTAVIETVHMVLTAMGLRSKPSFAAQQQAHGAGRVLPPRASYAATAFAVHWGVLLCVAVLAMNVQVTTRFLAAACPPLHWRIGELLAGTKGRLCKWFTGVWVVLFFVAGPVAHALFLPWT
eukprot:TRINITY_DN8320_c0_g1_i1.p1 TRINITY_DN8320_c0_g1~~TRINITY_DN8320_c0_g1_i1.p1  ORF type:complete len:482 (+),score=100.99 TRINITY_DN8320_c0_g1_i1:86-1531(+)